MGSRSFMWCNLAHNKRKTHRRKVESFFAPLFCECAWWHIAPLCIKTQGPNAHLAPVLEILWHFLHKTAWIKSHVCSCAANFEFWLVKLIFLDAASKIACRKLHSDFLYLFSILSYLDFSMISYCLTIKNIFFRKTFFCQSINLIGQLIIQLLNNLKRWLNCCYCKLNGRPIIVSYWFA